ncbi:MAG: flagellar protein FlgN [Ignavibacteriales bacterium]|nr:flagellar protein FlgN [Ignavibacteriales bacterium]
MRTAEQLADVLQTEADVSDELLNAMERKQESLIYFKADVMADAVDRERSLLNRMRDLELERVTIVADIVSALPAFKDKRGGATVSDVVHYVGGNTGTRLSELAQRIKTVGLRVQHTNQQNRLLLDSSARFIKHTLRILTDDNARQLVDKTI